MAIQVASASPERVRILAPLIARAFADDELLRWSLGALGPEETERVAADWFLAYDERLAREGFVWEAENAAGVAAWIPPGSDAVVEEAGQAARPITEPFVGARSDEVAAVWGWIHDHLPKEPHWYLDHVAVEPAYQGRGIGVALIDHGLEVARSEGLPCFLVTGREPLIAFYERRGFRVVHHGDADGKGPHVWFMQTRLASRLES